MNEDQSISKRYLGYYNGIPYCFGRKKDCKIYMEIHRLLRKGEYELKEFDSSNAVENTKLLENPDITLRMINDVILTERDHRWIKLDCIEDQNLRQEILIRMHELIKLFQLNPNKYSSVTKSLIEAYSNLYNVDEDEINDLIELSLFFHPLVSMHIEEYIGLVKTYNERDFLKERFLVALEEE